MSEKVVTKRKQTQTITSLSKDTTMSTIFDYQIPSSELRKPDIQQPKCSFQFSEAESLLESSCLMDVKEDDDCILVSLDLPGVSGKDISVSIQRNILSIKGFRCVKDTDGRVMKRQRLCRRFSVDTSVVDVTRAIANVYDGVLSLYAPKKRDDVTVNISITEVPDFVFSTETFEKRSGPRAVH